MLFKRSSQLVLGFNSGKLRQDEVEHTLVVFLTETMIAFCCVPPALDHRVKDTFQDAEQLILRNFYA